MVKFVHGFLASDWSLAEKNLLYDKLCLLETNKNPGSSKQNLRLLFYERAFRLKNNFFSEDKIANNKNTFIPGANNKIIMIFQNKIIFKIIWSKENNINKYILQNIEDNLIIIIS